MISSHTPVLPRWVISAEQCVIDYQSCIHQDKLLDCSRYIHPLENLTIELGLHHFYLHDTEASKAKFKVSKVVVALHTGDLFCRYLPFVLYFLLLNICIFSYICVFYIYAYFIFNFYVYFILCLCISFLQVLINFAILQRCAKFARTL